MNENEGYDLLQSSGSKSFVRDRQPRQRPDSRPGADRRRVRKVDQVSAKATVATRQQS
jgi:hypothetical protein